MIYTTSLLYFIAILESLAILLLFIAISYICWLAFMLWLMKTKDEAA